MAHLVFIQVQGMHEPDDWKLQWQVASLCLALQDEVGAADGFDRLHSLCLGAQLPRKKVTAARQTTQPFPGAAWVTLNGQRVLLRRNGPQFTGIAWPSW